MGYESYRVRVQFAWNGWTYAPRGKCTCVDQHVDGQGFSTGGCSGQVGTGCICPDHDHCGCGIPVDQYAGDIWIVEAGHPNKDMLLDRMLPARVRAVYDAGIPTADELLASGRGYEALTEQWAVGGGSNPRVPPRLIGSGNRGGVALAERS